MILNKINTGYYRNIQIQRIYLGEELIFPEEKFINLSWNLSNLTVTSYLTSESIFDNANDRPRINTFRSDGTFVIYMSAGNIVYRQANPQGFSSPWGDRSNTSQIINIPLLSTYFAGVDFFTEPYLGTPEFNPPLSEWAVQGVPTGNGTEIQYQYLITRDTPKNLNIFIGYGQTIPTAPVNVQGTPQDRQVVLNWEVPLSDGLSPITNYVVQYSQNQASWITVNTGSTSTTYTFTGLINNQNYYFRIAAVNAQGQGPYSTITGPHMPYLTLAITPETALFGMSSSTEWIEIRNVSPHSGRIDGWYVISHDPITTPPSCPITTGLTFTVPNGNYVIPPNGTFRITSGTNGVASNNPPSVFGWTNQFVWRDEGDIADLYDPQGNWVDTLATGSCLYNATGYIVNYSSGAGNSVTSLPVYPSLATYSNIDLIPSSMTRNSGMRSPTTSLASWRMRTSGSPSTTIQDALNNNKTIDVSIQNVNTGSVTHYIGSVVAMSVFRNSTGPTKIALVTNKTNIWSNPANYVVLFDKSLPAASTNYDLEGDSLIGLSNNYVNSSLLPSETIYFRFVIYAETDVNSGEFGVLGTAGNPREIYFRANNE